MLTILQFSYHQNIATYYGAFVRKGDTGMEDQLWVSVAPSYTAAVWVCLDVSPSVTVMEINWP